MLDALEHEAQEALPKLRGVLHAVSFPLAVAATFALVLGADDARSRIAAAVYGVGLCGLFGVSATYHRSPMGSRRRAVLRRIDHSMIFVFIAASYTPIALLVLHAPLAGIVLASVWAGAAAGVVFSLGWIEAPRSWTAAAYIALGWVAVVAAPQLVRELGALPAILLLVGGLAYSAGAVVYARQRPDPWPQTFGYHEVFHALVVAAATVHFVVMAGWVFPRG